jgi:hypothetical protein
MTFYLLKNAIETNPTLMRKLVSEVLDLPADKRKDLESILEKTSLEAIITASKIVADRLTIIKGVEVLLFDEKSKKQLLERKGLHRIIAGESWIFGEEYNLTNDDENLREVLKKHQERLGNKIDIHNPVLLPDGKGGVIDLVLGRTIPMPRADEHENLVIELKRPKVPIDQKALDQIDKYANAVASDERFRNTNTKWKFIAVSNEITDDVLRKAKQKGLPQGCVYDYTEEKISVWVKTWSTVLDECKSRLQFFQERLDFKSERNDAIAHLRQTYNKYLPESLKNKNV